MKSTIGTKIIWVFVFALLFSLPSNAAYRSLKEKSNPFETKIFEDNFNKDVFNRENIPLRGGSSDDDPNGDEDWIGKATLPIGDAGWLMIALVFTYGIYIHSRKNRPYNLAEKSLTSKNLKITYASICFPYSGDLGRNRPFQGSSCL
jgi:hypothetical protein